MTETQPVEAPPEPRPPAPDQKPPPAPEQKPPRGSSRTDVFFIQVAYLLALGAFVIAYRLDWIDPRRDFFGPVPFLVPWFGAVGAVLLSLTGVFDHRGRDWNPEYRFWHWARPFVGAIVATMSVLIFQAGILAVGGETPNQATTTATPKNLLYYIVAFVVGYREEVFRQLIRRVADVILTPAGEAAAAPTIESVEPELAAPGAVLTIVGRGLTDVVSVKVRDQNVEFVGESDTQMTVTIPDDAETGPASLAITTKRGTAATPFTIGQS